MFLIKFLFKAVAYLASVLILLAVSVVGLSIWIVPHYGGKHIEDYVERQTGFPMSIKKLEFSPFKGSAGVTDVLVENPSYYQERTFVKANAVSGTVQVMSLFRKRIIVDEVVVDVENVTWVRNNQDQININEFRNAIMEEEKKPEEVAKEAKGVGREEIAADVEAKSEGPKRKYLIKKLRVRLGSFSLAGFPDKDSPVKEFKTDYSREFTDVTDLEDVATAVGVDLGKYGVQVLMYGLLESMPLKDLTQRFGDLGFAQAPKAVTEAVGDVLEGGKETVKEGVKSLFEALKNPK